MVQIPVPVELFIRNLKNWAVIFFEDRCITDSAHSKHFHILIPTKDDDFIVVCLITSQIEKKAAFYAPTGEDEYLVYVEHKDISLLDRKSVIDCPQAELLDKNTLLNRIKSWEQNLSELGLNDSIKKKIYSAIKASNMVSQEIKDIISF